MLSHIGEFFPSLSPPLSPPSQSLSLPLAQSQNPSPEAQIPASRLKNPIFEAQKSLP